MWYTHYILTSVVFAMKTETKRQNFNVTPEQEAEIAWLKDAIDAPTTKDAILRAVRVLSVLAKGRQRGFDVYLENGEGVRERVLIPELETASTSEWQYLAPRPHPWRKQLFIKGWKLLASTVYRDMLANEMSREEIASNWHLPVEAIDEVVRYCEQNEGLIDAEAEEERRYLVTQGVQLEPPPSHRRRLAG